MQFSIKTVSGNTHIVDDEGQIDELDGLAANVWDVTGLRHRQTNRFIPIGQLAAALPTLDLQPGGAGSGQWVVTTYLHRHGGLPGEWSDAVDSITVLPAAN